MAAVGKCPVCMQSFVAQGKGGDTATLELDFKE
jgi:hypothetical protein